MTRARRVAALAGFALAIPLVLLVVLSIAEPPTLWGAATLAVLLALAAGGITSPWRATRARGLLRGAAAALIALLAARVVATGDGANLRAIVLPGGGRTRLVNRLFEEQDVSLLAGRLLHWTGVIQTSEVRDFLPKLRGIYLELKGGHFVFAEQAETCRRAIADWLLAH